MKLEKIVKSIKKNTKMVMAKFLLTILLALSIVTPISCPPPIPPTNEAPNTQVTKKFKDNGEVEYNFSGTDSDGSIDYISARFNSGNYQNFSNNSFVLVPIVEGNNTVEATAYDNEGLDDPTPATDSFVSPTEEEAEELIANTLNPSTYKSLEKDVLVSLGASDSFYVDFLVGKLNNTDAVIDYLGDSFNKQLLDLYGIPNLWIGHRTSTGEIEKKVLEFQENGYN